MTEIATIDRFGRWGTSVFFENTAIFLAHLSRRLTWWAYSIPMVRRPSVVVVHCPHFQTWISPRPVGNLDQVLCVASLGWGKGCIRFCGRLDQNSGFHGNIKPPLTYNGENDVSTFSQLFLIQSFLYLQVTRACIKSRISSNFGQIRPLQGMHKISNKFKFRPDQTTDFGVSCPWASIKFPIDL